MIGEKDKLRLHSIHFIFFFTRIKSTCCVQFSSKDQASETKMALNGVTWPVGNPKTLRVSFSTEEQMKKYKAVSSNFFKLGDKFSF